MAETVKCAQCKHKIERSVCGCSESPYYNHKVEPTGSCEKFLNSPAQDHFSRAMWAGAILQEGNDKEMEELEKVVLAQSPYGAEAVGREKEIEEFEKALQLGLPQDNEVFARFHLGMAILSKIIGERQADSPEFKRALAEMEAALKIDGQGEYGCFSKPVEARLLQHLAGAYITVKGSIQEREGIDSAISYMEQKRHLFDYLENPPSLLLLDLGELYLKKNDVSRAHEIFIKISEIPETCMGQIHADVRERAAWQIRELQSQEKKSGCFIATAVYGKDDAPEVEALRHFRDNFLLGSRAGRSFVSFYYLVSPPMADIIRRSGFTKNLVRIMLFRPVLWLIPKDSTNVPAEMTYNIGTKFIEKGGKLWQK